MKLGPHLHRIGNDIVAAYLVETPDGITVIDAGLPGHWRDLQAELAAMDRSIDDVRGVILTHGDSDHIGFAERLRRDHGVPVYVHSADADRARGGDKPKTDVGTMRLGPSLGFFAYALRKSAMRTTVPHRGRRGRGRRCAAAARRAGDHRDAGPLPRQHRRSTCRSPTRSSSATRSPPATC